MHLPEEPERPLTINILPMIDVIFAILAFLILLTLFLTPSQGLDVNLPKAVTAIPQTQTNITISIEADGTLALNQDRIKLEDLSAAVVKLKGAEKSVVAIVQADVATNHGRVVNVMDILRQIEGVKLAIATQQGEVDIQ